MNLWKAKDRLHKATTEALESKIDILEMDLKEEFIIFHKSLNRYSYISHAISD